MDYVDIERSMGCGWVCVVAERLILCLNKEHKHKGKGRPVQLEDILISLDKLTICNRFIGVFGLTYVINSRRIKSITYREQFIMAYGGLRGAVGFSLVTILPEANPMKDIFLTTTLVMIFFTVFIQGG